MAIRHANPRRRSEALESLWDDCPSLLSYLKGLDDSSGTAHLERVYVELEEREQRHDTELAVLQRSADQAIRDRRALQESLRNLLLYVRALQIVITRIEMGDIDAALRKVVEHIACSFEVHRTALELGQRSLSSVEKHAVELLEGCESLLGIRINELYDAVFDAGDIPKVPKRRLPKPNRITKL